MKICNFKLSVVQYSSQVSKFAMIANSYENNGYINSVNNLLSIHKSITWWMRSELEYLATNKWDLTCYITFCSD